MILNKMMHKDEQDRYASQAIERWLSFDRMMFLGQIILFLAVAQQLLYGNT